MPLSETSQKVLDSMKEQYGDKKGESVFYATANKKGGKAEDASTWKKKDDKDKKKPPTSKKRKQKAASILKIAKVLSAADRARVPKKDFAIPEKAKGKEEKKVEGK